MSLNITDNHAHINPIKGAKGIKAVGDFVNSGGTMLMLVNLMTWHYGIHVPTLKSFTRMYQIHLDLVRRINQEYAIKAYAVIGPHPSELSNLIRKGFSYSSARRLMIRAIDEACRIASGNDLIIAIGEVGRPHYRVSKEEWELANELLGYALERAAEIGKAVQIHMETPTESSLNEIVHIAEKHGMPISKIVIHHATPDIKLYRQYGLWPSIVAKEDNIIKALRNSSEFLVETDYLDDPQRPGAVMSLSSLPRKIRRLYERGILSRSIINKICRELPSAIYGIAP